MNRQFIVEYPSTLPDLLQESAEQFIKEARLAMAVRLFQTKRLPSGMAAVLAGMDRVTFLLGLHRHGVSMVELDDGELESDVNNA